MYHPSSRGDHDGEHSSSFHTPPTRSSSSGSSSPGGGMIRRKEEFVYIPYSYQIEQGIGSLCCDQHDNTPVMLRNEKAQMRATTTQNNKATNRLRRFTGIIYGYSAIFLLLGIHSFMTWRGQYVEDAKEKEDENAANPPALFGIAAPVPMRSRAVAVSEEEDESTVHDERPVPSESQDEDEAVDEQWQRPIEGEERASAEAPAQLSVSTVAKRPYGTLPFPPKSSPLYFDAFDVDGKDGYVADPTAMKQARQQYIDGLATGEEEEGRYPLQGGDAFWSTLGKFATAGTSEEHIPLTRESICAPRPGPGSREESYKLFAEKIQIATEDDEERDEGADYKRGGLRASFDELQAPLSSISKSHKKLMCAVYSRSGKSELTRTAALTWGHRCDGFLVFGDSPSVPELGRVQFEFGADRTQDSTWQMVRAVWAYLHHNYRREYDYFHVGGEDMYVIPENLRTKLLQRTQELPNAPIFLGQHEEGLLGNSGGPGYTVNRLGLQQLVEDALPGCNVPKNRQQVPPYEDYFITACLNRIGIQPMDSRDAVTGEQTYQSVTPHTLYKTTVSRHGSKLQGDEEGRSNEPDARGSESAAAARYSVSFHNLFHPVFMVRVHTLLHAELCPRRRDDESQLRKQENGPNGAKNAEPPGVEAPSDILREQHQDFLS